MARIIEPVYGNPTNGSAIRAFWFSGADQKPHTNNIVLASSRFALDPAHELGHLLTNAAHYPSRWNLMYWNASPSNTPTAPKRLTNDQEGAIRSSTLVK